MSRISGVQGLVLGYISAALKTLNPYDDQNHLFSVIPRDNPMSGYPSDFDLIELHDSDLVTRKYFSYF